MQIITTSWDDGSIEDFRLAEILNKYKLQGTFYIPRANHERPVITSTQIQDLSSRFEIGGHTLNHIFLTTVPAATQWDEIEGCYNWLATLTGSAPESFCVPRGLYNSKIIKMVQKAGFTHLRTTHLLDINGFSYSNNFPLMNTTVQLYPHSKFTYLKHLIKRGKLTGIAAWLAANAENELLKLTEKKLAAIRTNKHGCFHLWGHSWEIEQYQLWDKLEAVCKLISNQQDFSYLQNKETIFK